MDLKHGEHGFPMDRREEILKALRQGAHEPQAAALREELADLSNAEAGNRASRRKAAAIARRERRL